MKFAPGSFSKNFAWHGTGLLKLHTSIRDGFQGKVERTLRPDFRAHCRVEPDDLQLVPLNFFLHNHVESGQNWVSVDELVFAALQQSHSQLFDRLALFALHINLAGVRSGQNGVSEPALWIKDFVANRLWHDGAWRPQALSIEAMDTYFEGNLEAEEEVRIKCRSNYRHLLDLCGYLVSASDAVDSGAEQWIVAAMFLTWDRLLLDGVISLTTSKSELIDRLIHLEVHQLAGTTEEFVRECANAVVDDYLKAGGLDRFKGARLRVHAPARSAERKGTSKKVGKGAPHKEEAGEKAESSAEGLELDYSVAEEVKRRNRAFAVQIRNVAHVRALKRLYADRCQFCGGQVQVETSPNRFYSEGAHIKPVGKPHGGPDTPANILILCPNHHVELDTGMLSLVHQGSDYIIQSRNPAHPLHGKAIVVKEQHRLDEGLVRWQREFFAGRRH